nr:site-specific integrase [Clostridiales bacterium]
MKREEFNQMPQLVIEFLQYMEVIKNKSSLTIIEYASDLRTFFRYMKIIRGLVPKDVPFDEIDISDIDLAFIKKITLNDAYDFLSYCRNDRDNSANTRSRKVSSIRAFFKFLDVQKAVLDDNPMRDLDTPKIKKALPKYLTLEQSLDLLKNIDGKFKERDYCIITLFLNCGLRLSELVSLNYNDIR